MAIRLSAFLAGIRQIAASGPRYQTGGTGKGGVCDCVGLLMGAMYKAGRAAYPMHSSNYFARCQMEGLRAIAGTGDLHVGDVVYKARSPDQSGYNLHERYLDGGRYWTGDLLDYYHIGVVTGVSLLRITHCTKDEAAGIDGVTADTKLGKWAYVGQLKCLRYDDVTGDTGQKGATMAALYDAKVTTTGGILNIRATASLNGAVLGKVPNGALLQVLEEVNTEWARVFWEGVEGYAKRAFLTKINGAETDTGEDGAGVTNTLTAAEAAALSSIFAKL
jgi:hypothetical protein